MSAASLKSPQLVTVLRGGLGNQLFQYASALGIAHQLDRDLGVDPRIGFLTDYRYRRRYRLAAIPGMPRAIAPATSIAVFAQLAAASYRCRNVPSTLQRCGSVVYEGHQQFYPQLTSVVGQQKTILEGYWQTPLYFEAIAEQVAAAVLPETNSSPDVSAYGKRLRDPDALVVGIRQYEEASQARDHGFGGRVVTPDDYSRALDNLKQTHHIRHIYVFSTRPYPFVDSIQWPIRPTIVETNALQASDIDILWLMSQSQNLLINNSSFYWWAAWLSSQRFGPEAGVKMVSANFLNQDSYLRSWNQF